MRRLPDIITASRIVVAAGLALAAPFSAPWYACYLWCGASDVLDGMLARRLGTASAAGARLDSAADCALAAALAASCACALAWQAWMVVWVLGVAAMRAATLVVCRRRFGRACFLHTWANKLAGFVLFVLFALIPALGLPTAAALACAAATLSSAEELALVSRMPQLDVNCRGLWARGE